jgi:hypothetical protein
MDGKVIIKNLTRDDVVNACAEYILRRPPVEGPVEIDIFCAVIDDPAGGTPPELCGVRMEIFVPELK